MASLNISGRNALTKAKAHFDISGGCLAILGRYEEQLRGLVNLFNQNHITHPELCHFKNIYYSRIFEEDKQIAIEVIHKYLSLFPFSRTMVSSVEDLVNNKGAKFDVENYSLNEVMHCMFHVRALTLCATNHMFDKCPLQIMIDCYKEGIPFWKAYLIAFIPCSSQASYWGGGDANIYDYYAVNFSSMLSLLRGSKKKPKYDLNTLKDNIDDMQPYEQNVSSYLRSGIELSDFTMQKFYRQLFNETKVEHVRKKDMFGDWFTAKIANVSDCSDTIDSIIKQRRLKTERLIC